MNLEEIRKEMNWSLSGEGEKDILVVVRNGYEYVRNCVESIFRNTKNFNLYLWDNASSSKTANYLNDLAAHQNVKLHRSEINEGFIIPNNRMAAESRSEWVIFLNSDTEVLPRWDEVLIGVLKNNSEVRQVGFGGGLLGENCEPRGRGEGENVDYVFGYCFCLHRKTIEEIGLFDEENMQFAYCEDSDLSLRIRERGWRIRSCYSEDLVRHYGSKTTQEVIKEDNRVELCAKENLAYLRKRWKEFLRLYKGGKICYHR